MMAASTATANWNSGCAGLIRYAVWMLPILAWWIAEHLVPTRRAAWALVAVAGLQFVVIHHWQGSYMQQTPDAWRTQMPLAAFVLSRVPALYSPEPEIFSERQLHTEVSMAKPLPLPLAFATEEGTVTKILADARTLPRLAAFFSMPSDYLAQLCRRHAGQRGLFYITPPPGRVTLR
jgi:hypothetical protein